MITSPDYINQKIVQYIENRLATEAINKKSFEYDTSFEDYLKIINNRKTIDELLLIRTSIINDIMQGTTIQNLQRAKGLDLENEQGTLSKSELGAVMKLKRFIQQLTFAKAQCEKGLTKLGWTGSCTNDLVN